MVIVVVDDEPDARALARRVLERGGHTVFAARNGEVALRLVTEHDVDVVLTDLHMPRMDGEELASRMAAEHPDVPVVIWSTVSDRPDVRPKNIMDLQLEEWVVDPDSAGTVWS